MTSSISPAGLLASSYSSSIRGSSIRSLAAGKKSTSPLGEPVSQHEPTTGYLQRPSPGHRQRVGRSAAASCFFWGRFHRPVHASDLDWGTLGDGDADLRRKIVVCCDLLIPICGTMTLYYTRTRPVQAINSDWTVSRA